MPPTYRIPGKLALIHTSAEAFLPGLAENKFDSVVCDPPYGLEFMGAEWDRFGRGTGPGYAEKPRMSSGGHGRQSGSGPNYYQAGLPYQKWCEVWAREAYRVLKPGGYLVAFGGTRTYHRLACAIEDAGFEIRDSLHWIYGSGFPKSLDVSKAIDKAAGAEREVTGDKLDRPGYHLSGHDSGTGAFGKGLSSSTSGSRLASAQITAPATPEAQQWDGWGTALKPAHEPIILARKPLAKGKTVAANVLEHGTGGINVDGCRVGTEVMTESRMSQSGGGVLNMNGRDVEHGNWQQKANEQPVHHAGRWPPNIILTHSPGCKPAGTRSVKTGTATNEDGTETTQALDCAADCPVAEMDQQSAGASRFFPSPEWEDSDFDIFRYQAKAAKKERPVIEIDGARKMHPTVKPVALMRWLVRLVTPPGGVVLDPFGGTGTTGAACLAEGFRCILLEQSDTDQHPYIRLARKRLGLEEE